jgi:hypothetical protein
MLGSVAALGGSAASAAAAPAPTGAGWPTASARTARRADPLPAGEIVLLGLVFAGLAAGAPGIARPLLDRGIADCAITPAEADAFLARLATVDGGGPAPADPGARLGSRSAIDEGRVQATGTPAPAALAVFQNVFSAIRRQLPEVAKPLVLDAVATGEITQAQARRIEQRLLVRAHLASAGGLVGQDGLGLPKAHTEPLFTGRLP